MRTEPTRPDILHYLEGHHAAMNDEFETLDSKAIKSIEVISIITAIVGGFSIANGSAELRVVLGITLGVYVIAFGISFMVLFPRAWHTPLDPSRAEVDKSLSDTDRDFYDYVVNSHLKAIEENSKVLKVKARFARYSLVLIGVDMLVIFVAAIALMAT